MNWRRTTIRLAAGVLGLSAALAFGAVSPLPLPTAAVDDDPHANPLSGGAPETTAGPALSGNPLWAIALKELVSTRERPLFSRSRRPPSQAAATYAVASVSKPVELERPQLTLVGTIAGDHEGFGIFIDQSGGEVIRLKTGQSHNGWVLRRVERRETVLERNDETVVIALPTPAAQPAAAAPRSGQRFGRGAVP